MPKDRAFGADAVHLIAKETTYGTPPAGPGAYRRMPLRSNSLGATRGLEDDPIWNRPAPDASDPSRASEVVDGTISMPMDSRGAGFGLSMALGAAVSVNNGDGTYTHTFKSGKDLFSYSSQTGHPKLTVPKWRTHVGAKAGGLNFSMARNGRAIMEIPMIAQSEIVDGSGARDAAPLSYAYLPFDNAGGAIKLGGATIASVTGGSFAFSNGLEPVETIRADGAISNLDEGQRTLAGTVVTRFGNSTSFEAIGDAFTPAALEMSFQLASLPAWTLKFQMARVFFEKIKAPIEGPGGMSVTYNWRAAYDTTAAYMLAVLLTNDVATY